MSLDDCFIPFHSPLREPAPYDRWRKGTHPCWSQLDLDKCAAADPFKGGGGLHGEEGVRRRVLQILSRPVAVPPRRLPPPLGPLPKISAESEQPSHLQTPSLYKEDVHVLPEGPKQHPSEVAISSCASRGRYARSRAGGASKERSTQCIRSRAGWASKERSTPEGVNMEEHAWRFQFTFPQPPRKYCASGPLSGRSVLPRQKKPPEVRNALREKRIALRQKAACYHAEVALCKYNRANNTKFELVEVRVIRLFFEFGGGCIHYNFTAKPEDHHSADGSSTKLFFSEVNANLRDENDVLLCCIVGENDAGHCHGCDGHKPAVVHPSSQAYGGGSSTCINFPGSDGSSDSD
uniref:Uncharacterized protein n=1 Tax=Avena sativa TaxID=4498 RepID=A0ACD5WAV8_AVESA